MKSLYIWVNEGNRKQETNRYSMGRPQPFNLGLGAAECCRSPLSGRMSGEEYESESSSQRWSSSIRTTLLAATSLHIASGLRYADIVDHSKDGMIVVSSDSWYYDG